MTGIEKVTAKILADAEADAKAILERADADCAEARARCDAAIRAEQLRLDAQAERECEAIIARAKSSAAAAKRQAGQAARAHLLEDTYAAAEREMNSLSPDAYLELLVAMLRGAIRRRLAAEQESRDMYGEDITPERYEVVLNRRDRDQYGPALLDGLNHSLLGKATLAELSRVVIAKDTAPIAGGLILRCGMMEVNCSYEMLFAEVRRRTEIKVNHLLFGENETNGEA